MMPYLINKYRRRLRKAGLILGFLLLLPALFLRADEGMWIPVLLNPASAFPAACGGVSEHKKNRQKRIEDSSQLAARSFNQFNIEGMQREGFKLTVEKLFVSLTRMHADNMSHEFYPLSLIY